MLLVSIYELIIGSFEEAFGCSYFTCDHPTASISFGQNQVKGSIIIDFFFFDKTINFLFSSHGFIYAFKLMGKYQVKIIYINFCSECSEGPSTQKPPQKQMRLLDKSTSTLKFGSLLEIDQLLAMVVLESFDEVCILLYQSVLNIQYFSYPSSLLFFCSSKPCSILCLKALAQASCLFLS